MARMENARKYIDASITAFPDCLECPHEHHKTDKDDLCAVASRQMDYQFGVLENGQARKFITCFNIFRFSQKR